MPDALSAFQRHNALFRTSLAQHRSLVNRYEQWLTMQFEDWGYAHRGMPRIEEIAGANRLYLAEGFGQQTKLGMNRLATDLVRWRFVLQHARTLPMKMLAAMIVEDDVHFLSRLVSRPTIDRVVLIRSLNLLQPLTSGEYSLKWPVQSELMLGYKAISQVEHEVSVPQSHADSPTKLSLAEAIQLRPETFRAVEHPTFRSMLGFSSPSQRTWDMYAAFYDATIKAAESVHSPLPKLQDIARSSHLTLLDRLGTPPEFSPNWEPFSQRLVETDAKLRLASLQIIIRNPSTTIPIPTRLAEVGSSYFDPFSGLPMLWSPTQNKLYSVGKDKLDDGGDPVFDISVPLPILPARS